jgi:tRNA modification GTPase
MHQAAISARTGAGLRGLKVKIREILGASEQTEGSFSARQRHIDALQKTAEHLAAGEQRLRLDQAAELLAEELRLAQKALGEITGEMLPDDLLGAIFASFCIGK